VDQDKEKAKGIWEVSRVVISWSQTKTVLDLGLNINYDSLPFEKVMMFSWIKEALGNGRKD
jgi:hypothetical protein